MQLFSEALHCREDPVPGFDVKLQEITIYKGKTQAVIFRHQASFGNGNFPLLRNQILGEINAAYDDGKANGDLTSRHIQIQYFWISDSCKSLHHIVIFGEKTKIGDLRRGGSGICVGDAIRSKQIEGY